MIEGSIEKYRRLLAGRPPRPCKCGRGTLAPDPCVVVCEQCYKDGAQAFWDLMDGRIGYATFLRRLRGKP